MDEPVGDQSIHASQIGGDAVGHSSCLAAIKRCDRVRVIRTVDRSLDYIDQDLAGKTREAVTAVVIASGIILPIYSQVILSILKFIDEAIFKDIDLVDLRLTPEPCSVVSDVADFKRHIFSQFALDTKCPGLYITRP